MFRRIILATAAAAFVGVGFAAGVTPAGATFWYKDRDRAVYGKSVDPRYHGRWYRKHRKHGWWHREYRRHGWWGRKHDRHGWRYKYKRHEDRYDRRHPVK